MPSKTGAFDVRPKANRLRDGREVHFAGEARLAHAKPSNQNALAAGNASPRNVVPAPRDPPDFDVFRRVTGELWGGEEDGVARGELASNKASVVDGGDSVKRSFCAHCTRRFAGVFCRDCRQGYCLRRVTD